MSLETNQVLNDGGLAKQPSRGGRIFSLKCMAAVLAPLILIGFLITGCETNPYPQTSAPLFTHFNLFPAYTNVLHEADVIDISFRYSTNFNTIQKVGLDGMVNLVGAGQVKASGKTVAQLQNELTELYKTQVKDDPITLKIIGAAVAVYVTGAVNHPGKIPMERPLTVMDAISEAGGVDPYHARLSKVSVLRVVGDTQTIFWLNLNDVLDGSDPNPFYLKPFDVVNVPMKTFNF
jgi:polysaccharide export outer membrane protein